MLKRILIAIVLLKLTAVLVMLRLKKQYESQPVSQGQINAVAVFSGDERSVAAQDFEGGYLRALMGGVNLDLTGASIPSVPATFETTIFMGGVALKLPSEWTVENRAVVTMGGVNNTRAGSPGADPDLIITGRIFMGGLDIS